MGSLDSCGGRSRKHASGSNGAIGIQESNAAGCDNPLPHHDSVNNVADLHQQLATQNMEDQQNVVLGAEATTEDTGHIDQQFGDTNNHLQQQHTTTINVVSQIPSVDQAQVEQQIETSDGLADMFSTPPPPVLNLGPPEPPRIRIKRRRNRERTTTLRRSARLAKRPAMPLVDSARRFLCKRLGLISDDEENTLQQVLADDYISMFHVPLPTHVITALTAIFDLDNSQIADVDAGLLQLAGEGAPDIQDDMQAMA